jgi:hypothetical protein
MWFVNVVKTYLHSWGTMPIMDENKAIMAKVVIDSTGDGDLLPHAGAAFDVDIDPQLRNVDFSSLRKQLIVQNVPLPSAYPDKYSRVIKDHIAIYENPIFRERNLKE